MELELGGLVVVVNDAGTVHEAPEDHQRLGDGWMPIIAPDALAEQKLGALREKIKALGRDPAKFGIEGWLRMQEPDPQRWAAAADGWRRLGADMVMLYPMYRIPNFADQIETLRRFKEVASG